MSRKDGKNPGQGRESRRDNSGQSPMVIKPSIGSEDGTRHLESEKDAKAGRWRTIAAHPREANGQGGGEKTNYDQISDEENSHVLVICVAV